VFTVCADEVETGRVQGRQLLRLLPRKGLVLYVQGSTRSVAARDRTSGMRDSTRGAPFDVDLIEAGWTRAEARSAVAKWFRIVSKGGLAVDLVSSQNDQIALGVLDALQDVASETGRPELARIPVCGCDGTPQLGQTLVGERRLLATVVLPRSSGPAVEAVARLLREGAVPPPISTLEATSFPAEATLQPLPPA
jgi:ABC-type sugar transport system substrate-binding protein